MIGKDIDMRPLERGQERVARYKRGGYQNALFADVNNRALDGESMQFNTVFDYKGTKVLIKAGAFGDISSNSVSFCRDHIASSACASTDDGALELMVDDEAIRFRLNLSKVKGGEIIARLCEIGDRDATSIGCDILEESDHDIGGEMVRVITKAKLREISACSLGAYKGAFCQLVDTTVTPKPTSGSESNTFKAGRILHKVNRQIKAMRQRHSDVPAPRPKFAMTVEQSNRLHTEETEALQQRSRGSHSLFI